MNIFRRDPLSALLLAILSLSIALIIHMRLTPKAAAQLGCTVLPPTSEYGHRETWSPGITVSVNIDSTYIDANQRDAIKSGFENWTATNGNEPGNCSGVVFGTFSNNPVDPALLEGAIPPRHTVNVVKRADRGVTGFNRMNVGADGRMNGTVIFIPACKTNLTSFKSTTAHEVGHSFGLENCSYCGCDTSVMATACPTNDPCNATRGSVVGPTSCDNEVVGYYYCVTPTPTPTPVEIPPEPCDGLTSCYAQLLEYCQCEKYTGVWDENFCRCSYFSPVLIDMAGDGFALTDAAGGVNFDLRADGSRPRLAWTSAGSNDSWLALDRDGSGAVEDGRELFGNFTEQPEPPVGEVRNGFQALAEFDKSANGGNGDGVIDPRDAVFAALRLWRDANHNGVSEPGELFTLSGLDIARLHLNYNGSKRTDEHGNRFRYRAKVDDAKGAKAGRWAWDVFLVSQP